MRRIVIVSCALAGAVVLVAGCGGKPWSQAMAHASPTARLLSAVQETTAAHTADFALAIHMTASVPGVETQKADIAGTGVIDFAKQNAEMTMKTSGTGQQEQLEMRVVGGKIYANENGDWTETSGPGVSENSSVGASSGDPTQYMQYLDGVSPDVHMVGNETIDGTNTTEYAGTIDLQTLLASPSLSETQREKLRAGLATMSATIPPIPFSAWLDESGRLRRFHIVMGVSNAGDSVQIDLTMTYSNFGVAVDVQPPPGYGSETPGSTSASGESPRAVIQDRAAESDLRNALTVEKTIYTDDQKYTADIDELSSTEGSLDWGRSLHVAVGAVEKGDNNLVCMWEASKSGAVFAIADVAFGPSVGTYYGTAKCPATVTGPAVAKFGETPWGDTADNDSGSSSVDTNDAAANAQSALRNALTAEKTIYTDEQMYTADLKQLRDVESSLAWGTKVHVYVADAVDTGDKGVVCIWETDSSVGKLYSIADVAAGPDAGTYFGTTACPAKITPSAFKTAEFSASW